MVAFSVYIINIQTVLGVGLANPIEKSLFLLAAMSCLLTRKVDFTVIFILFLVLCLVFLQTIFVDYPGFSWSILLGAINQFVIIYAFLGMYPTVRDRSVLLRFISYLAIASSVLGVVYGALGIWEPVRVEFATGGARFRGTLFAAAFLSGVAMISTFAALQVVLKEGRKFYAVLVLANFMILLLSGGRAALVLTLMVCAASVFMERSIRFSSKIGMLAGGFTLFAAIFATAWERILNRFLNSGDNGREILWDYIESLNRQYPSGIGFGHQYFSAPEYVKIMTGTYAAHNDFLRIALELSYPGMLVFYGLMALAILRVSLRGTLNAGPLLAVAFLAFLILSNSDNALATPPYFPLLLVAYLASIKFFRAPATAVVAPSGEEDGWREVGRRTQAQAFKGPLVPPGTLELR